MLLKKFKLPEFSIPGLRPKIHIIDQKKCLLLYKSSPERCTAEPCSGPLGGLLGPPASADIHQDYVAFLAFAFARTFCTRWIFLGNFLWNIFMEYSFADSKTSLVRLSLICICPYFLYQVNISRDLFMEKFLRRHTSRLASCGFPWFAFIRTFCIIYFPTYLLSVP